jgi:predicted N-acetyltransferase YhbS
MTIETAAPSSATTAPAAIDLGDGLVLRQATAGDLAGIVELSVEAHGEQERPNLDDLIRRHGADVWTVVVDGDTVVSTTMLLARRLIIGDDGPTVDLPVGQPEYVATDPAYRRRGLIRAQIDWHHRQSTGRGDLLQVIYGIPYFYRRFGYSYGLGVAAHELDPITFPRPDGWTIEAITPDDLAEVERLDDQVSARADLRLVYPDDEEAALLDVAPDHPIRELVARRDGQLQGWMRCVRYEKDEFCEVGEIVSTGTAAAEALLARALEIAGELKLVVVARPGDPSAAVLASQGRPVRHFSALYTRVPDARALLEAMRPVLSHRLATSPLAGERGELALTLYREGLVLPYDHGRVGPIEGVEGVEDPGDDTMAVPPDAFPALVLGRFGASGLEARHDDVNLGHQRALADVLFPQLTTDTSDGL